MPTILVVDDEQEVRAVVSRFFKKKGYEVVVAEDAEEAIGLLEKERVDAVLLDIELPGMSGVEALGRIRARWRDMPVVMISGQQDEEVAKDTLRYGAFDYMVKPIDFDYLERTVYLKLVEKLAH